MAIIQEGGQETEATVGVAPTVTMIVGARVGVASRITTASPDATEVAVGDGTAVVATEGEVGATALISECRSYSHRRHASEDKGEKKAVNSLKEQLDASTKKMEEKASSSQFLLPLKTITMPKKTYRFDDKGREINEFGEIVETTIIKPVATLAINKKKQQKAQVNP